MCENCYRSGDFTHEYGRAPCNDIESQSECQQANWEVLNKRDTTVTLVERVMQHEYEQGNLTAIQMGFIRSVLALTVEDGRPEGDCSNGLSTNTGISGTITHCFSPELLIQCKKVADGVDAYLDGMAAHFRELFFSTVNEIPSGATFDLTSRTLGLVFDDMILHPIVQDMYEMIKLYAGVKTARVRCASYNATVEEISLAPPNHSTFGVALVMMLTVTMMVLVPLQKNDRMDTGS